MLVRKYELDDIYIKCRLLEPEARGLRQEVCSSFATISDDKVD